MGHGSTYLMSKYWIGIIARLLGMVFSLLFIVFNLTAQIGNAPDPELIDSLEKVLDSNTEPNLKRANTLTEYAWAYLGVDPEVSIESFTEAISISVSLENWGDVGKYYNMRAYIKMGHLGMEEALKDQKKALSVLKEHNVTKYIVAQYNVLFNVMVQMRKPDEAWKYADSIKQLVYEYQNIQGMVQYQFSMGFAYSFFGESDSAESRYTKGLILAKSAPDTLDLSNEKILLLNNLGSIYNIKDATKIALDYYLEALQLSKEYGVQLHLTDKIASNIGVLYFETNDYEKALRVFNNIENKLTSNNNLFNLGDNHMYKAKCYIGLNKYDSAKLYLDKAQELYTDQDNNMGLFRLNAIFATYYYKIDRNNESLDYNHRIYNNSNEIPFLKANSCFKLGLIYFETGEISKVKDYVNQCIEIAKPNNYLTLISDSYKLLADYNLAIGRPDIALVNAKLHDKYEDSLHTVNEQNLFNEISIRYETQKKEVEIVNQRELVYQSGLALNSERKFQSGLMMGMGMIILLGFFSVFTFISGQKNKRQLMRQRQKLSKAELKSEISELKLLALRTQLNPGFIFNTLHTIQELIINSESDEAYDSLSKFSILIQFILECTKKEYVTLKEETEFLERYVSLEKLILGDQLEFTMDIDPLLLSRYPRIPPMVIQPHLENAIQQRLKSGNGKGKLNLSFTWKEGFVQCRIVDNGDPKQKKVKAKKNEDWRYSAISIESTKKRLKLYKKGAGTSVKIVEMKDSGGNFSGTAIELLLPVLGYETES